MVESALMSGKGRTIGAAVWLMSAAVWLLGAAELKAADKRAVYADAEGVLRWQDSRQEVALFGVNYCLPSGYSYKAAGYVGADRKKTVEADLTHIARLGLDGLRLSFWGDWENSDRQGNLIDNEHLDLLDYVIAQAEQRGLFILLTPITLYSPVWPEPEETNSWQGFPRFYPKQELGLNPEAIAAQQRYLAGIVNHVNRYTGRAYKDEPAIVIIEPVNEPHHHPAHRPVEYIDALVKSIRDTGCRKMIFFNVSQDMAIAPAVRDSQADGATFGWYPTGLVSGFTLESDFLPRVESYRLLFDPALKNKPKAVYEFDAADVAGSYLYPAMARAFRSGGGQFAAMFSYDPVALASRNLEYQTHFLNLLYTPGKAVSLLIAAEAFRRLPQGQSSTESERFGPVRVSYEEDLSELADERNFFYSNTTRTVPPKPQMLERAAGCGSSPIAEYEGTGAYFLEKQAEGLWHLEVYPDAVWIRDPFGRPSRGRLAACLLKRQRAMKISLPDLGTAFSFASVSAEQSLEGSSRQGTIQILPGFYVLKKGAVTAEDKKQARPHAAAYVLPKEENVPTMVRSIPPREVAEGRSFAVRARIVSPAEPQEVILWWRRAGQEDFQKVLMQKTGPFDYEGRIDGLQVRAGIMEYAVSVEQEGQALTFPARRVGPPTTPMKAEAQPMVVYDASAAPEPPALEQWFTRQAKAEPADSDGRRVLRVQTAGFEPNGSVSLEIPLRLPAAPAESPFFEKEVYEDVMLILQGRALAEQTDRLEITLTDCYGMQERRLLWLDGRKGQAEILLKDTCIANLRTARLTFGAWLFPGTEGLAHGFEVEKILLRPGPLLWQVPVVQPDSVFVLLDAAEDSERLIFPNREHRVGFSHKLTRGMSAEGTALRVEVPTFRPAPQDVSLRLMFDERIGPRREDLKRFDRVRLRARAGRPATGAMELLLIGQDGWVRAVRVPLTTQWQEQEIALSRLEPATASWLPRPYPTVGLDYWDQPDRSVGGPVDWSRLEAVQISIGGRLFPQAVNDSHAVEIEQIVLECSPK